MAKLRVKVEVNKGGVGVRLFKLSDIAGESLRFFQMLCKDADIETKPEDWLARDFGNDCVDYECQIEQSIPKRKVDRYSAAFRSIASFSPKSSPFRIRRGTIRQFSNIAKSLDAKEVVSFGLPRDAKPNDTEWFHLSKEMALQIQKEIPACVQYYGPIQGVIHSFHKESERPHITIREQISGSLVNCFFPREKYEEIVSLMLNRLAVIYTEGTIFENVISGNIESVESDRYKVLNPITSADLDAIFGTDELLRQELFE